MWRRKPTPQPVAMTGVGAVLTASHRPPHSLGPIHEHTWEIIAWVRDYRHDALSLQKQLDQFVEKYAGQLLPDQFARAEDLASAVAGWMACPWDSFVCARVDVSRPAERLYARWPA